MSTAIGDLIIILGFIIPFSFMLLWIFYLADVRHRYQITHERCMCKHDLKYHMVVKRRGHTEYLDKYSSWNLHYPIWFSYCKICDITCHNTLPFPTQDLRRRYLSELEQLEYDFQHPITNTKRPLRSTLRKINIRI